MKITNEYVQINIGNKTYTKKNMILNTYLFRLFASQLDTAHDLCLINSCYIKFNDPIENVDYDTILSDNDFDLQIINRPINETYFKKISENTKNSIRLKYTFDNNSSYKVGGTVDSANILEIFNNKKITALAFGYRDNNTDQNVIFAFQDTTNMNIVLNTNENLSITRSDLIQSDGICRGFDYPLHLVNDIAFRDQEQTLHTFDVTKAQLYSIGFGNTIGLMEEEYLINDVEVDRDDTSITFDVSRVEKLGHYPSEDLFFDFYPTMDNSKYMLFKYRLYRIDTNHYNAPQYLDEYYTMSKPNQNFGDLEIKLKIERS